MSSTFVRQMFVYFFELEKQKLGGPVGAFGYYNKEKMSTKQQKLTKWLFFKIHIYFFFLLCYNCVDAKFIKSIKFELNPRCLNCVNFDCKVLVRRMLDITLVDRIEFVKKAIALHSKSHNLTFSWLENSHYCIEYELKMNRSFSISTN